MTDKELFEKRFAEIGQALKDGTCDFPFHLDYHEGRIWLQAQESLLLWVLEMLGDKNTSRKGT